MQIVVTADGWLSWKDRRVRCALGRNGVALDKTEGDGKTPAGKFALRRGYYRADRRAKPASILPFEPIDPGDGWCDDPDHKDYNRLVRLPHPARCEALFREDRIYDLLLVIGYNDRPPSPGRGSAIFLHLARPGYLPTEGCVALMAEDFLDLMKDCDHRTMLRIEHSG